MGNEVQRLSVYLERGDDRGFLATLGGLILLWAAMAAILFGCTSQSAMTLLY